MMPDMVMPDMAEAAKTKAPAPAAEANGHKPGPVVTDQTPAEDCVECLTSGERMVGLVGVAIGVAIAAIGIDLLSGGALSGWLRGAFARGEEAEGDGAA
jgi:hypothetical protein